MPLAGTDASTIPGDPVPLPSVAAGRAAYLPPAHAVQPHERHVTQYGVTRTVVRCRGRRVETVVVPGGAHRWPTATDGIDGARTVTSFFGLDRR